MNVQHLDSVSVRITESTGVVIDETIPDAIVDQADELIVVDLTPALRERIIEGSCSRLAAFPSRSSGSSHKESLDALREIALLQVVEEVEAHRLAAEVLDDKDRLISNVAAKHGHHVLALVKPDPSANSIVRRAWEMSERLGGRLDLL
jgi:two-component system, OmpR family, sensor histidine kinase KdpD